MPRFSGVNRITSDESFNLVLDCFKKSQSLTHLSMWETELSSDKTMKLLHALNEHEFIEKLEYVSFRRGTNF